MNVEKLGKLITDRKIKYNVSNSIENCLVYFDRFLSYLIKNKPDIADNYLTKLKSKVEILATDSFKYISNFNFNSLKESLKIMHKHQVLIDDTVNYHLSLLNLPEDSDLKQQIFTLLHFNVDRGNYYPRYYLLKILTELLDRDEAIQFFKNFSDYQVKEYLERPYRESLTEVFELDVRNGKDSESSAYVSALINEGLYAARVDKCMGHEALKELNDIEIAELVICYSDFAKVKKGNEHFVLTRSCTLHNGPYCDNLYHDTRIVKEVKHLPRDFFDNLDKILEVND